MRGGYQSTPCLGYAAVGEGKPHVIVEDEFKIYQYIADLYDFDNLDATAIARKVNELGYRTKRGNPFEARTVNRLLRNKFYAGIVSWNGIEFDGPHEVRISKERFKSGWSAWNPLINLKCGMTYQAANTGLAAL